MIGAQSFGGGSAALSRGLASGTVGCTHSEAHELALDPAEALALETVRECPCCGGWLWISVPPVGTILDLAASSGLSNVPDLRVRLTRRERQLVDVLHRADYQLRHSQLAALVWSDPNRGHDVRSTLYRLRAKLRGSPWTITIPPHGEAVRLVRVQTDILAA